MTVYEGYEIAKKIQRLCRDCRNAKQFAVSLGIEVYEFNLHNLKGMYSAADRHRTIYLNNNLGGCEKEIVTFHEICHDQIPQHRKLAKNAPLKEIQLFGENYMKNRTELEANIVVSHLYINEEELLYYIKNDQCTINECAASLKSPVDLLLLKLGEMKKVGTIDFDLPDYGDAMFLKNIGFGDDGFCEC